MSKLKMKHCFDFKHWDSLSSFVEFADNADRRHWERDDPRSDDKGDYDGWHACKSYKEASELVRNGWPEGCNRLAKAMNVIAEGMDVGIERRPEMDVMGPIPFVGEYLAGNPECMYNPVVEQESPIVNILVDLSVHGGITTVEMFNRGAAILSLVQNLEESGRRCCIYMAGVQSEGKKWAAGIVCVKQAGEEFNLHTMAYALANTDFYRRHYFRYIETYSRQDYHGFEWGYGRPGSIKDIAGVTAAIGEVDIHFSQLQGHAYGSPKSAMERVMDTARESGIIS